MSDNFEFDDNDDILLNAFRTPPNQHTSPEKRLNEENDENIPVKRSKPNHNIKETTSPIIQFTHNLSKSVNKGTPTKNNSLPNAKRIFPGPAGILLGENQTDICSQDTSSFFQDGPWEEMSKDFKISSSLYLFDKFNIAWIKKEATANRFANQKAPFLAGILLSLEVSEGHTQKSINITLRDMTGTIQGTILQNLYEEYASHFTLGSVLVLIQFGVLSCTCDKCDNHHLTITPKNLSAIYSGKEKIIVKLVNPNEVLKEFCQRKKELELATCKPITKPSNFNSPVNSNVNTMRCTFSNNTNMAFQNPSTSKKILSQNTVNRTVKNLENALQKFSTKSQTTISPNVKTTGKSISEAAPGKEVHGLQHSENMDISCSPVTPTRLFTFKKVNSSPKHNTHECDTQRLSDSSRVTLTQMASSSEVMLTSEQVASKTKKCIDYKNVGDGNIENSEQLSIQAETLEQEKMLKDLLSDVDVNSFFDDEF